MKMFEKPEPTDTDHHAPAPDRPPLEDTPWRSTLSEPDPGYMLDKRRIEGSWGVLELAEPPREHAVTPALGDLMVKQESHGALTHTNTRYQQETGDTGSQWPPQTEPALSQNNDSITEEPADRPPSAAGGGTGKEPPIDYDAAPIAEPPEEGDNPNESPPNESGADDGSFEDNIPPTTVETYTFGDRKISINPTLTDQELAESLVSEIGERWRDTGSLHDAGDNVDYRNRRYLTDLPVDRDDTPTLFVKVTYPPSSDSPIPDAPQLGRKEVEIAPLVQEVIDTDEMQQAVATRGFTGISFVNPIAVVSSPTEEAVYYRYIAGAAPLEGARDWGDAQPGSDLDILNQTAGDIYEIFQRHGIHPGDLAADQMLVKTDEQGNRHLYLIDTERFESLAQPQVVTDYPQQSQIEHAHGGERWYPGELPNAVRQATETLMEHGVDYQDVLDRYPQLKLAVYVTTENPTLTTTEIAEKLRALQEQGGMETKPGKYQYAISSILSRSIEAMRKAAPEGVELPRPRHTDTDTKYWARQPGSETEETLQLLRPRVEAAGSLGATVEELIRQGKIAPGDASRILSQYPRGEASEPSEQRRWARGELRPALRETVNILRERGGVDLDEIFKTTQGIRRILPELLDPGKTISEIAQEHGVEPNTVSIYASRAIDKLRQAAPPELADQLPQPTGPLAREQQDLSGVGPELREICLDAGILPQQLAEQADVHRTTVHRFFTGQSHPSVSFVRMVTDELLNRGLITPEGADEFIVAYREEYQGKHNKPR